MDNENEKVDEEVEELEEPQEVLNEDNLDVTDWKAEALKRHGIAKRFRTKIDKIKNDFETYKSGHPEVKAEQPQDKKDFDLAEKSYLMASGIKKNEISLVWDEVSSTKKPIDEILDSKYFQEKLEIERSKNAIPSGTNRSGGAARNEVDYWVQKGEYPPKDQPELRRKVASALAKQAEMKSKFTDYPIA